MPGSTAALAVQGPDVLFGSAQGPVLYLAPRLQVAVQGPEVVFGSTAANGSARTSCCIWLHGCKWQCKDQLLYLAPWLQVAVQGPV